jgi:hypothetical protein
MNIGFILYWHWSEIDPALLGLGLVLVLTQSWG